MQWQDLISEVAAVGAGPANPSPQEITGVEYDSRRVKQGSVFVAMRGGTTDGNCYIEAALQQGASAIITDSDEAFAALTTNHPQTPALLVEHGRIALAQASAAFFNHPERQLHSIGVTGTNGKTTTAFLIEALLNVARRSSILVGTIEYHIAGQARPSAHTTPESRDLFELMTEGIGQGATELVMEVSSHALDQGRVAGVPFDIAVFTNLTRDHLDYHRTMEEYFAAKQLLFDGTRYPAPRIAVLNTGDPHSDELAQAATQAGSQVVSYGMNAAADWRAEDIRLTPAGVEFHLVAPQGSANVRSGLAGKVNVLNLLGALAAAGARGIFFETLLAAIPELKPVPGRFEPVDAGQPFTVIVDYAHTDDALRNLTALARQLVSTPSSTQQRRIITLFGCGGDRDRTKRPKMGLAAGEGSDFVVVTSDNPRSEDPKSIIAEILPGITATSVRYVVEPDRTKAIELALHEATSGDIVLIAGKGHEKEQILREGKIFFDDAEVALSTLRALGYGERR
jgi:UDP-N-acetylmuramoyl-L-alanyl-D-glutamate--2,6-diaminopimelate ligase